MRKNGAGEMAQWLRALPALPKVLSSIPSNHMCSQPLVMRFSALFWPAGTHAGKNTEYTINK